MKKLIYNLIILGALSIGTQYKAQHLLEALDAPLFGGIWVGEPPIGDTIQENKCKQQGFTWQEATGCYCPRNEYYRGGPARWTGRSKSDLNGIWECEPNISGGAPVLEPNDPEKCAGDQC